MVAGDDEVSRRWHAGLGSVAADAGYVYVFVDAAETKVHMIDQLYAAVAQVVDWDSLVGQTLASAWREVGLPPSRDGLSVAAVAAHHDVDAGEAARSIRRQLEASLLRDTSLVREFRVAILRLCQAKLGTGEVTAQERQAVLPGCRCNPWPCVRCGPPRYTAACRRCGRPWRAAQAGLSRPVTPAGRSRTRWSSRCRSRRPRLVRRIRCPRPAFR
ncbi:MAG: hypothetical protein H0U77_02250 [Nocardioidaceae bacterium]|nr:hypothetical protein [Nocardioidaceae bacterium]